jgi:translation initiation factor 1
MGGLGDLGRMLAERGIVLPEGQAAPAAAPLEADASVPFRWVDVARVVLQRTRAGRGGKTVTLVRGVAPEHLHEAARTLKKSLGVGASVDGDAVAVQGDQGDRLRAWLEKAGVRRIVGE